MKTPTVEQLQAWTQQWDEVKPYLRYQKVFDQRLQPSQPASDTAEIRQVVDDLVNQVEQEELRQDPTEVEQVVGELVDQVEGQDQQAKNAIKAQVCEVIAGQYIATLNDELGDALENLGLEPPWSARNRKSGLYRTDDHVIPLAIRMLDGLRLSKASRYDDFAEDEHQYGCTSPISYIRQAHRESPENHSDHDTQLANVVDELTKRLLDLRDKLIEQFTGNLPNDRATIKPIILEEVRELLDTANGESLVDIDQAVTQATTNLVHKIISRRLFVEGAVDIEDVNNIRSLREEREFVEIEGLFIDFNQEENAKRHLSDYFDLAFCANASESEKSAARLQALKDSGITKIDGVLRGASVYSARALYDFPGSEQELIKMAKHAVVISSYGLLKATLDEMNARNIHVADDEWIEMIYYAFNGDEPSIIKQCLDIKDESGKSLLEGCTIAQQYDLLRKAISADIREHSMRINEDRLQMLLDRGVSVNAKDRYGDSVLMSACSSGYETIVSQLIKAGIDINAKNMFGETALRAACAEGQEAVVTQLIEARADVNVKDKMGVTALMTACAKGQEAVVSKLIEAKSDLDIVSNYGKTALTYACCQGHDEIVTQLIEKNADINAKGEYGHTALMGACINGHGEIVTQLIEKNADINATTDNGQTALMYACRKGHGEIVTQLIEAGADVSAKDSQGKTAYEHAVYEGYTSLANRVIALESVGTRANRIARETGRALGDPTVLTALAGITTAAAGITTAALYASGSLDTALESTSQAMPDIVSTATNATSQVLTELTTAAIEIGRQMGYGPSL
jgi:ankyrin repeat protein